MVEIDFMVYKCFGCEKKCSLFTGLPDLTENVPEKLNKMPCPFRELHYEKSSWVEYKQETKPEQDPKS